jgi:hypothetical protein
MATRLSRIVFCTALAATAAGGFNVSAQPPALPDPRTELRAQVDEKIADLDSPFYSIRRHAAEQMEQWLRRREMTPILSERFEQLRLQADLPLEIRWRISIWRNQVPRAKSQLPTAILPDELEQLVRQLDDDSYALRLGASERLRWMARSEHLAGTIIVRLRRRLAESWISEDCFQRVDSVGNVAWAAWMANEAPDLNAPSPSDEQIQKWLDALTREPAEFDQTADLLRRVARRRLLDALTQDRDVPRLKAAMEARAAADKKAAVLLSTLVDLIRPAVVLESWSGGEQGVEQLCLIGAPAQAAADDRLTIFDRVNDETVHCQSGNVLPRGNYPLGVAFLPPSSDPAKPTIFFLTNLSTPRRQIAYSYAVKLSTAGRLARLSRQTLDRFAVQKGLLGDDELTILSQLDAGEVSRFAGRFFATMNDGPVESDFGQVVSTIRRPNQLTSRNSCFGAISIQLLKNGTRDAAPGLIAGLRQKKFRPPTASEPYCFSWMAALAIAKRDPWPDLDAWLAENLDNPQTIMLSNDGGRSRPQHGAEGPVARQGTVAASEEPATVGAMAAAMLARRHAHRPASLGLVRTADKQLEAFNLYGYRYAKPDDIARVRQWWKEQSAADAKQM